MLFQPVDNNELTNVVVCFITDLYNIIPACHRRIYLIVYAVNVRMECTSREGGLYLSLFNCAAT